MKQSGGGARAAYYLYTDSARTRVWGDGTGGSEIVEVLSQVAVQSHLYVEWSTNEKVALEVAAAASFAGLRSLCAMKQNGVNVASDFLLHLAGSGTRGGMVLVACDDPGALSSVNEGESRHFAKLVEIPLLAWRVPRGKGHDPMGI